MPNKEDKIPYDIILKSDVLLYYLDKGLKKINKKQWIKYSILIILFLFIYPIVLYFGAKASDVWEGIDYPLKDSRTTYIGDCVIGLVNALIISFYLFIPKVFNKLINKSKTIDTKELPDLITKHFSIKKFSWISIILAVVISLSIHLSWWFSDDLQGWTESAPGIPNVLGMYHTVLFAIQTYILLIFIRNIYKLSCLLNDLKENIILEKIGFRYDPFCLKKCGGLGDFADLFLRCLAPLLVGTIYIAIVVANLIDFNSNNTLEIWCYLELILITLCYVIFFSLVIYGIIKPTSEILKWGRENEKNNLANTLNKVTKLTRITQIENSLKKHELFQYISEYSVSIINSKTLLSPLTIKLLLYLIAQTTAVFIKLKVFLN